MKTLEGKTAIITGAAGGIGAEAARLFHSEGANVMLVDINEAELRQVGESIARERVATMAADVSKVEHVEKYFAATVQRFGKVDILFANAGIEGRVCPMASYPLEEFDRVLAVNVRGVWLALQCAAREFERHKGGGSIVVTSSIAGLIGAAGLGAYVASKHAVIGLVRTAALELAPLKVRVNAVNPGPIENRMMRSIETQASPQAPAAVKAGFESKVALGRYGTNAEIAQLALFLASDASSYCTGGCFVADGGFVVA
jgi:NAD(P)-dependent dehydrogenase (short-subunit alcohol dehydrogenase family)